MAPLISRPRTSRCSACGSREQLLRPRRVEQRQQQHHRQRHRDVVVERRRQRLDDRRRRAPAPAPRRACAASARRRARAAAARPTRPAGTRAERAEDDEGREADPALARVPRQARAAGRLADERGHAVADGEDAPAGGGHPQPAVEGEDHRQHRQRVGEDADRVAAREIGAAPQAAAADPRQHLPVEQERGERERRRLRRVEPAQQQREADAADVHQPAQQLAAREAHAARPHGGTEPLAPQPVDRLLQALGERPRAVAEPLERRARCRRPSARGRHPPRPASAAAGGR